MTYLRPDAKSQVTVEYEASGRPVRIDTIVLSTQHDEFSASEEEMLAVIRKDVEEILIPRVKATCPEDVQNLFSGYKLYVNGEEYVEGSSSEGEAIVVETSSSSGSHEGAPGADGEGGPGFGSDGNGGPGSDGNGGPGSDGSTPPAKPDGDSSGHGPGSDGSEPPAKPGE